MKRVDHKREAQFWLEALRRGTDQYEHAIKDVRQEVQKGGLTLQDIGTSEEELEQLRVKGCKTSAQFWLEALRRGTDQYEHAIKAVRQEVQKGGLTLQDIGTSEEELGQLQPAVAKK